MSEEWNDGVSHNIDDKTQESTEAVRQEGMESKEAQGHSEAEDSISEATGSDQMAEQTSDGKEPGQVTETPQEEKAASRNPYAQYDTNQRQDQIWQGGTAGNSNNNWQNNSNENKKNK